MPGVVSGMCLCVPTTSVASRKTDYMKDANENSVAGMLVSMLATGLLVLCLHPFRADLGLANVGFLFLLLTHVIASSWGRRVGLFEAVVAALAFNFSFIEPLYRFTVDEPRN